MKYVQKEEIIEEGHLKICRVPESGDYRFEPVYVYEDDGFLVVDDWNAAVGDARIVLTPGVVDFLEKLCAKKREEWRKESQRVEKAWKGVADKFPSVVKCMEMEKMMKEVTEEWAPVLSNLAKE